MQPSFLAQINVAGEEITKVTIISMHVVWRLIDSDMPSVKGLKIMSIPNKRLWFLFFICI